MVQRTYNVNPAVGFPGQIAEPNSPYRVEVGVAQVPTNGRELTPGDSVYWDATNNGFAVPAAAANQLLVCGIVTYRADHVANDDDEVKYADGDEVHIITQGVVWVTAGGASEYNDILQMQIDDWKYDALARVTAVADMLEVPIVNLNRSAAVDTNIIKAGIGMGRVL